ncbi:ROK family protein (plasmid) [Deinococcus taeanensis]|uniref:ROK family transcriptional regulator n=1 Tax=Deinococcus taeanensis TaxID=2737050 RepID=UPI001CDD0F45|nr:ROK family transcriptional regulator [Deinococcus taeanensis]UBV45342.1 ROK family protein [Deinococcus taeanensis]
MIRPTESRSTRERVYTAIKIAPATRPEIAAQLGLSLPTVIAAVDDLIQAGVATLDDATPGGRGRPPARVRFTPESLSITTVDLGGPQVTTGRYDLAGTRTAYAEHGGPAAHLTPDPERNFTVLLKLLEAQGPADLSVISALGAINPRTRTLTSLPLAMRERPLEAQLSAALGQRVLVENDANLSAWHTWHTLGLTPDEPLVFLNFSHGIGLGLMLGGQLYHGATGGAGEVSFAADPGKRGRHELLAYRLFRHLHAAVPHGTIVEIAALAAQKDTAARRALRAFNSDLANHLTAVAAVLDPTVIVLQDIPQATSPLQQEVQRALSELGLNPKVLLSPLGPLGGLDSAGRFGATHLEQERLSHSHLAATP